MVHDIRTGQAGRELGKGLVLWHWCRAKAWYICDVMDVAKIKGPYATPKGLSHGFGIKAVTVGVPLNMLQEWLGHAELSMTSIHADAVGPEAKQIAERM
ncbi:MAG: hypothetical protein JO340_16855 [Acidobacteriaceae bacterium]|nr:hypothetical protein [Acidobacteriaceae bacterium]